ncbi:MAG TPA: GNAT family N-acetyltransferase [Desulfobacterales bacterium]
MPATTPEHIDTIRALFRSYEQLLNVDLCFQGFEAELAGLPGRYAPPEGALLIAFLGDEAAGCVAMRKHQQGVCEMKRLFVRPFYRRCGIGRRLAQAVIQAARDAGYTTMLLDTLTSLGPAMRLYERIGFKPRAPYYENPLPNVVYWELSL